MNVFNGRILSTFGLEFNTEMILIAFDPKRKHFDPIKIIPGLKNYKYSNGNNTR